MRRVIIVLFILLMGCSSQFDVKISDAAHSDVFSDEKNISIDTFSFILQNNEVFDLTCDIILTMDNVTNRTRKVGDAGLLHPGARKNISISVEMFYGETDIDIFPQCVR